MLHSPSSTHLSFFHTFHATQWFFSYCLLISQAVSNKLSNNLNKLSFRSLHQSPASYSVRVFLISTKVFLFRWIVHHSHCLSIQRGIRLNWLLKINFIIYLWIVPLKISSYLFFAPFWKCSRISQQSPAKQFSIASIPFCNKEESSTISSSFLQLPS